MTPDGRQGGVLSPPERGIADVLPRGLRTQRRREVYGDQRRIVIETCTTQEATWYKWLLGAIAFLGLLVYTGIGPDVSHMLPAQKSDF